MGIALVTLFAVGLTAWAADIDLAALVAQAESQRDARVLEVRSLRQYIVRNPRWKTDATMDIRMITSADGSKRYELLATNAEGLRKTILMRIIEGEISAPPSRVGWIEGGGLLLLLMIGGGLLLRPNVRRTSDDGRPSGRLSHRAQLRALERPRSEGACGR